MVKKYEMPLDWKSELWWRKRSQEERLYHLTRNIPKKLRPYLHDDPMEWSTDKFLLINGPTGSGKTSRAASIATSVVRRMEMSGYWVGADDYIQMLKDSFDNDYDMSEEYGSPYIVKYVKNSFDLLVIDGLGEERLSDFAQHEIASLIRKRFDMNKSTIVTSSLPIGDIRSRYGSRLAVPLSDFDMIMVTRNGE